MATTTSWLELSLKGRAWSATMVTLGVCLLGGCGSPGTASVADPATAAARTQDRPNPNPALFARDAEPYGHDMEFWAEQWWRWIYSVPAANNPFLDPTLDSNQDQSGPVLFLVPGDRTNTVPHHRAIAVTPSTVFNDYPCPDPTFQPAPGQSLLDFLLAGATPINDGVVSIDATLDGQALSDLLSYRVASDDLMYFVGDLSLQPLDGCITGARQPGVVDSLIFMIKPLEPGRHVLTTRVVNKAGKVFAHTQILDVQ